MLANRCFASFSLRIYKRGLWVAVVVVDGGAWHTASPPSHDDPRDGPLTPPRQIIPCSALTVRIISCCCQRPFALLPVWCPFMLPSVLCHPRSFMLLFASFHAVSGVLWCCHPCFFMLSVVPFDAVIVPLQAVTRLIPSCRRRRFIVSSAPFHAAICALSRCHPYPFMLPSLSFRLSSVSFDALSSSSV